MPGPQKTDRTKMIEDYAKAHPKDSLADIGRAFRVSKQRVREIVGKRPRK